MTWPLIVTMIGVLLRIFAGVSFVLAICLMCAGVDYFFGDEGE